MGSPAKKDAFEWWKAGDPLEQIQLAMRLKWSRSPLTVKKWVGFWDRKKARKALKGLSL